MINQKYIITIDGPAASGKGSLAKIVSSDLNLYYMAEVDQRIQRIK